MTRVKVGPVDIRSDIELTPKQIKSLLNQAAAVALALSRLEQPEPSPPVGFTAHLERLPDEFAAEPGSGEDY